MLGICSGVAGLVILIFVFHTIGKFVYIWKTRHVRRPMGLFGIGGGDLNVKEAQVKKLMKEQRECDRRRKKDGASGTPKRQDGAVADSSADTSADPSTAAAVKIGRLANLKGNLKEWRPFKKKEEKKEETHVTKVAEMGMSDKPVDEGNPAGVILHNYMVARRQFMRFTEKNIYTVLFFLFFMYPNVARTVIDFFGCRQVGDKYYVITDMRLECYSPQWYVYQVPAGIYVLVFPIGVPLGFLALLYYYGVPRLAERRVAAAWLHVALQDAWQADVLSNRSAKKKAEHYGITEALTVASAPLELIERAVRAQRKRTGYAARAEGDESGDEADAADGGDGEGAEEMDSAWGSDHENLKSALEDWVDAEMERLKLKKEGGASADEVTALATVPGGDAEVVPTATGLVDSNGERILSESRKQKIKNRGEKLEARTPQR